MSGLMPNMLRRDRGSASTSLGVAASVLLMLAGCSQQEGEPGGGASASVDTASEPGNSSQESRRVDKEAAATLSITRAKGEEFESDYARAVACSSAIHVMTATIRSLPASLGEAEMRMLARAEQIYRENAERYGRAEGVSGNDVRSAINEAIEIGRQSATDQTRVGMACLQNLAS